MKTAKLLFAFLLAKAQTPAITEVFKINGKNQNELKMPEKLDNNTIIKLKFSQYAFRRWLYNEYA